MSRSLDNLLTSIVGKQTVGYLARSTEYHGNIDYPRLVTQTQESHQRRTVKDTNSTMALWFYDEKGHRMAVVNLPPLPDGAAQYPMMGRAMFLLPTLRNCREVVWVSDVWVASRTQVERYAAGDRDVDGFLSATKDPAHSEAMTLTVITADPLEVFTEIHDYIRRDDGSLAFLSPRPQDDLVTGAPNTPPMTVGIRAIDPDEQAEGAATPPPEWLANLPEAHPLRIAPSMFSVPFTDEQNATHMLMNPYGFAAMLSAMKYEVHFDVESQALGIQDAVSG